MRILSRKAIKTHRILSPQIDDWRAMVDSVMIDSACDGH